MKIIEPFFEFIDVDDPLKKIEICGRVCYKSESKITSDSAETFVKNLIRSGHESVLEHADYIVLCDDADAGTFNRICNTIERRNGGRVFLKSTQKRRNIISGNVRAWRDFMRECAALRAYPKFLTLFSGILFDDVNPRQYWKPTRACFIDKSDLLPEERDAHYTETVRFVVDRGISHEIVRHRTASFSQESTRYCNYGGGITFIKPPFFDETCMTHWIKLMENIELFYMLMIAKGAKPQEAREILPNSTKTEIIMTATRDVWKHFFELRTAAGAHPQMKQIAIPLCEEMNRRWENDDKCYFRVDDAQGNFKRCNALVVGKCKDHKCKFRKTEQEYEAGIKNAKQRLKDLGLIVIDKYTETGERIMTTERKRV